jgi:hypothetical protein
MNNKLTNLKDSLRVQKGITYDSEEQRKFNGEILVAKEEL